MRKHADKAPIKISDLFEVYKKRLRAPQGSVIIAAIEVIHDMLGVSLEEKQLLYSPFSRILTVRAQGPLKTEIILRKEEILAHLKGRLGPQNAPTEIL